MRAAGRGAVELGCVCVRRQVVEGLAARGRFTGGGGEAVKGFVAAVDTETNHSSDE